MADWIRYERSGSVGFGTVADGVIRVHSGDMFQDPAPTGEEVNIESVKLLTPVAPSVMVALWNNFYERARVEKLEHPTEPLYFFKPASCFHPHGAPIKRPASWSGRVVFEAELGVVIGKTCAGVAQTDAHKYVFGYTCINDVTAQPIIKEDPAFQQWCRAKGFDTFGPIGPHIRTDVDPDNLVVKAVLNGKERQNYPVSDMIFSPLKLVSRVSDFMTLRPGDVISCGTSLGAAPLRDGSQIDVIIDGVGTLSNIFED